MLRKSPTYPLLAPGDIIAFDLRVITCTVPMNNVGDFEPNVLPFIEFSEPDFPWRFTPAKLRSSDPENLPPWILLIVLEEREFSWSKHKARNKLPSIEVNSVAKSLPNLNFSFLLACVKNAEKHEKSSRILCPRSLEEYRSYHAFLVPTFKSGVYAGLDSEKKAGDI